MEKSLQEIEDKVESVLQSAILENGKTKAGRKTSHNFDEDVISGLLQFKTKLATTKAKLTELGRKASNLFQVDFGAFKKKSRSNSKQNKHRAAKRKAEYLSEEVRGS